MLVDSLLRAWILPELDIDKKWAAVARRRLEEIRSGAVKAVPGEKVFESVRKRFNG